jgi:uncharacterized membrane protein
MRRISPLARWFEPFASGLWIFFCLATLPVGAVWIFAVGDENLARWCGNADLRAAFAWLIGIGDFAWITLAAANVYLSLAETEGLPTARRWALILGGGSGAVAATSALTGFPLGRIVYSAHLGVKIGPVPVGLPLLWFAILIGSREAALRILPRANRIVIALGTAALAALTDANLEPLATKVRALWFWSAEGPALPPIFTPPAMNGIAWFVAAFALTLALREEKVSADLRSRSWKPLVVLALLNGIFLAANVARWLRG